MEPGSFTSEPQDQRPDQRNSDIDYVRRPEPIVPAQPMEGAVPVPAGYAYDGSLAKRLLGKFGTDILTWNQLDYYGNAIPLGSFCYALAFITYGFYRCKVYRIWRNWPMHCWILRMVQRKIIRYCFIFNLRILLSLSLCLLYNSRMVFYK